MWKKKPVDIGGFQNICFVEASQNQKQEKENRGNALTFLFSVKDV